MKAMIAITLTEFRKHYKEYLERSKTERVMLTNKGETYELVPQKRIPNDVYFSNPAVIRALKESEEDAKAGRVVRMTAAEVAKMLGV
jgi:PHD/YefM family antitoxin component YafN of YafNO toxin-antitoxin module